MGFKGSKCMTIHKAVFKQARQDCVAPCNLLTIGAQAQMTSRLRSWFLVCRDLLSVRGPQRPAIVWGRFGSVCFVSSARANLAEMIGGRKKKPPQKKKKKKKKKS